MNETLNKLFDAHVAFEMQQWQGKKLERQLSAEVDALWEWLSGLPLAKLSDEKQVKATARRLVVEMPLPDSLAVMIAEIAHHLVNLQINRETRVADVLDESMYDEGVELLIELEPLREALIKRGMDSPLYAMMASELLYSGIKDYVFSDSNFARNVPGVSALISRGTSAVNKRLPQLEAQVEKRVRAYIESNTTRTLKRSEALLLQTLTEERIRGLAAEVWEAVRDAELSVADLLGEDDIDRLAEFGLDLWWQLRETEYLQAMIDAGIERFFELHGERPVTDVLEDVGVTRSLLQNEASEVLPPLVAVARETGLLDAFIRRRLEPFYASKAASKALA